MLISFPQPRPFISGYSSRPTHTPITKSMHANGGAGLLAVFLCQFRHPPISLSQKKKGSSISLKLDHPILALHCFPSQSPPLHSVTSFQDFIPTKKDGRTRLRPPPLHCSGLFFALRMSITASTGVLVPPTNGLFSAVRAVTHARRLTCLPPVQPPVGCSSDVTQHSKASA